MKELNYCSECDKKLSVSDKKRNRENMVDHEEWTCADCDHCLDGDLCEDDN